MNRLHRSQSSTGFTTAGQIARYRAYRGPNVRKPQKGSAARLTCFLLVVLILALWWAYVTFTAPASVPVPAAKPVPMMFRGTLPEVRLVPDAWA